MLYFGVIDAKIRASDKDLPVQAAISEVFSTDEDPLDAAEFSAIGSLDSFTNIKLRIYEYLL